LTHDLPWLALLRLTVDLLSDFPNLPTSNIENFLIKEEAIWFVFSYRLYFWISGWMVQGRGGKMALV
jgi:hypothetical protein